MVGGGVGLQGCAKSPWAAGGCEGGCVVGGGVVVATVDDVVVVVGVDVVVVGVWLMS